MRSWRSRSRGDFWPAWAPALLCALGPWALGGCTEENPLAARLAERSYYSAEVVTFSPRPGGQLLVEVEVRSGLGDGLETLTVTLRQHDAAGEVLAAHRVPLDLSAMDATGVLRVYSEVPAHGEGIEALSAIIERDPPEEEYAEFPEIAAAASR